MKRPTVITLGAAVLAAVAAVAIAVVARGGEHNSAHDRQAAVAKRGSQVMPFDLERSTHRFVKTADGGLQTVVSDDGDPKQIALIRDHLRTEARLFRQGAFDDPVTIHGADVPGVADIRAGAARIDIAYSDVADGARLRYRTDDALLVVALHRWFDAQTSDHGAHAEGG